MHPTRRTLLATGAALPLVGFPKARAAQAPGRSVMRISNWPATLALWINVGAVAHNAKLLIFHSLLGYGPDGQMAGGAGREVGAGE